MSRLADHFLVSATQFHADWCISAAGWGGKPPSVSS